MQQVSEMVRLIVSVVSHAEPQKINDVLKGTHKGTNISKSSDNIINAPYNASCLTHLQNPIFFPLLQLYLHIHSFDSL